MKEREGGKKAKKRKKQEKKSVLTVYIYLQKEFKWIILIVTLR